MQDRMVFVFIMAGFGIVMLQGCGGNGWLGACVHTSHHDHESLSTPR
jgi:hypothetical protein